MMRSIRRSASVEVYIGYYISLQKISICYRLMLAIQMYIPGDQEHTRVLREGLVRRVLLMLILLLRSISPAVRRRYPTLQTLVKEGIYFYHMLQLGKWCKRSWQLINNYWLKHYCIRYHDSDGKAVLRIYLSSCKFVLGAGHMVHFVSPRSC